MVDVQLGTCDGAAPLRLSPLLNKIGGLPDWPNETDIHYNNTCNLCSLPRPLVMQCYAPFENSIYHRVLYVFACINPLCWNRPESWSCIRMQFKDSTPVENESSGVTSTLEQNDPWCDTADDWGDGSVAGPESTAASEFDSMKESDWNYPIEDEDMEDIILATENLRCTNTTSRLHELQKMCKRDYDAMAEIETDDEFKNVQVEQTAAPACDITSILNHKPELPENFVTKKEEIHFLSSHIRVYSENVYEDDHRAEELLRKYELENEKITLNKAMAIKPNKKSNESFADEEYEKGIPLHGDLLFHSFLSTIKMNPDQLIRYSLNGKPLLLSPMTCKPKDLKCLRCGSRVQFELQLLPTLITQLKLPDSGETHLEYGTAMVWTCAKSCWTDGCDFASEIVILQNEPN